MLLWKKWFINYLSNIWMWTFIEEEFLYAYILIQQSDILLPRIFCGTSLGIFRYIRAHQILVFVYFFFTIEPEIIDNEHSVLVWKMGKVLIVKYGRPEPIDYIVDRGQSLPIPGWPTGNLRRLFRQYSSDGSCKGQICGYEQPIRGYTIQWEESDTWGSYRGWWLDKTWATG